MHQDDLSADILSSLFSLAKFSCSRAAASRANTEAGDLSSWGKERGEDSLY